MFLIDFSSKAVMGSIFKKMYVLSTSHSKWCRTYLDVEDEEEEHEAHEQTHDVSGSESDQQIQADVVEKHLACEIAHTCVSHQPT